MFKLKSGVRGVKVMHHTDRQVRTAVQQAISTLNEANHQQTGGKWLEQMTVRVAPCIREWDIVECWLWSDWPSRKIHFPNTTNQDVGIDCVAVRRSDGEHISIQCKSRQLNEHGHGSPINKPEFDSFASASAGDFWAERWIVTNGSVPLGNNVQQTMAMNEKPVKMVNIAHDLLQQQQNMLKNEKCPHCESSTLPNGSGERRQTKSCMQSEAVEKSVRILKEHEQSESGGLPKGQARGKIILPCGTGKTRISLRIVEKLTPQGGLSIVLCPSIALVAQIRREYLQNTETNLRALAVCSDETAGYDPKKESTRNTATDPTVDNSNISTAEVKGKVTTDPDEIVSWIHQGQNTSQVNIIIGTYQSGDRIAQALSRVGIKVSVLIADEAHRTAGLHRKRAAKKVILSGEEERIRNFTLCHDGDAFPATYRVYQTATPRIYDPSRVNRNKVSNWVVRSMDDESVFGVELYRKSYVEAVKNGWLADYRIIAVGVNGPDAHEIANRLAGETASRGRNALTTTHFLRGLAFALAMSGATRDRKNGNVPIKSCIAFMNTVDKSKNMAQDLQTNAVRNWLKNQVSDDMESPRKYTLEHLDATSNVTTRDNAKQRLTEASDASPHGIINVGIFGEGTDTPSLNAVAFLEARKSPLDVIQAAGRAMRTADGKEMGYIICPILIPPNVDPEQWLSISNMEEGWHELGQVLLALRAHDQRIEESLADLLQLYIPQPPPAMRTIVAVASGEDKRISYREHEGRPGEAQEAIERVLGGRSTLTKEFQPLTDPQPASPVKGQGQFRNNPEESDHGINEPTQIVTGKKNSDGSIELRVDSVARSSPQSDGSRGQVDIRKSKKKARDMINKGKGIRLRPGRANEKDSREERTESSAMRMILLSGMSDQGNAIRMNLLSKSGLVDNRIVRDMNILESSVKEAAHHLRNDKLQPALDRHFGLQNLSKSGKERADGCTIAALLLMNAAMLHQRIANGGWLSGISDLEVIKNDVNVVRQLRREWDRIMRHDFRPVLEPAVSVVETVEDTGKLAGLERALHHIAAEAERIAETYADMGADHAGPLFNRVMGNQASDGAFFTRPVAASIAARLALDACGDPDWTDPQVWREHKAVDLACGSGTLLAALLTDIKRRARQGGSGEVQIAELQKIAVEETIKGLDINPVSLQLAAAQLTAGNHEIRYRQMGLHIMPYGPLPNNPARVSAGTLELLSQKVIVPRRNELMNLDDEKVASQTVWDQNDDAEMEDAVEAVKDARIVIMNPPFTNRSKMGEKYPQVIQQALRDRVDGLERMLTRSDPDLMDFSDKNSIEPLFLALAIHGTKRPDAIITMINPTIALSAPSVANKRRILAERYHIHTVLTCHQPSNINLSQNTNINESIIVARRQKGGVKPPTRFIQLDRFPADDAEVDDLHECLHHCSRGAIANGWGEVAEWPVERMEKGDWTLAVWRSPILAEAASKFAKDDNLLTIEQFGLSPSATGQVLRGSFEKATADTPGSFPILKSKGSDAQTTIQSQSDEYWVPKNRDEKMRELNGGTFPEVDRIQQKAGHLLITAGQDSATGRLTATADDRIYVGNGWMPVSGLSVAEAKAIAVFINSTAGRLQLMRHPGRKIAFPTYSAAEVRNIRIPDVKDVRRRQILADCWERTREMIVPQFRDGDCVVRRLWDEAVAEALGWDDCKLANLRKLLGNEPHVRGLAYGEYSDELETAERNLDAS